jgi:hypothetical protein
VRQRPCSSSSVRATPTSFSRAASAHRLPVEQLHVEQLIEAIRALAAGHSYFRRTSQRPTLAKRRSRRERAHGDLALTNREANTDADRRRDVVQRDCGGLQDLGAHRPQPPAELMTKLEVRRLSIWCASPVRGEDGRGLRFARYDPLAECTTGRGRPSWGADLSIEQNYRASRFLHCVEIRTCANRTQRLRPSPPYSLELFGAASVTKEQ